MKIWSFYRYKTWQISGKWVTLALRGPRFWLWFKVQSEPGEFRLASGPFVFEISDFPF